MQPILRHPVMKRPFILMTDAIGAVLGQIDDEGKEYAVAYISRGLKLHKKNYAVIELEALAIVWAMEKLRTYVFGQEVLVYTDHCPLQWLFKHRDTASRLIRWALKLQQYNIRIVYRKGKAKGNADALSRIPQDDQGINIETVCTAIRQMNNNDDLFNQQKDDKEILKVICHTTMDLPPELAEVKEDHIDDILIDCQEEILARQRT